MYIFIKRIIIAKRRAERIYYRKVFAMVKKLPDEVLNYDGEY